MFLIRFLLIGLLHLIAFCVILGPGAGVLGGLYGEDPPKRGAFFELAVY